MKRFLTSISNFAPDNGSGMTRDWLDISSAIPRKFFAFLFCLLFIGVGNVWGAIADGTYVLCTSTSDLNSGSHYIITSGTSGTVYCIKNEVNGNNRKTVSTSFTSGKIVVGSSSTIMTFTMGGSSNAWTFYTDNYNQVTQGYLTAGNTSNKNYLQVTTGGSDNKQKWTIAFGTNTTITANAGVSPYMQYNPNNGSPIFSGYRSAGAQSPVYLYKKGVSITFQCNGATSGCPDNLTAEIKLPNPLPSAPTKSGYTFGGWYTNEGCTTEAVAGASISSNTTLYAKWESASTINVTSVSVSPTSKAILIGETFTVTPTVAPANATDKSVSWTSSASGKASVNSSGVVTGVAAGTANIICTTTDGSFTATCATTVYSASVTSIVDEDGTDISSSGVSASVSGRTLTASEGSTKYKFKTWKYGTASGTSISSATSLSTSLTGTPTGNVTLIAEFYKPVEVAWTKGGTTYSTGSPTTSVKRGTQWKDLTIPTAPGDASLGSCADKFMGWSNCSDLIGTGHSAPAVLFTSVSGITTEITAPIEFKAVFAKASAGGSGNIQLSYTSLSLTTSYESGSTKSVSDVDFYCNDIMTGTSGSDGYQKIQFKKSSTGPGYIYNSEILPGNITSIVFGSTTRDMTVNFGTSSNPDGSTETTTCSSSSLTATPTGNYKYFKILNSVDNAAYTGTITINYSSISYSNYVTQCCTELGSINGSFLMTTKICAGKSGRSGRSGRILHETFETFETFETLRFYLYCTCILLVSYLYCLIL